MAMTIISQLIGALIIPQIMERLLKEETPFHLQDLETQIDLLFDHYFYQYQSPRS